MNSNCIQLFMIIKIKKIRLNIHDLCVIQGYTLAVYYGKKGDAP